MAALTSVLWTRLIGGMDNEWAYSVTIGADSAIYVAGATRGLDPYSSGAHQNGADGFITRFNTDGTQAWTRQVGVAGYDDLRCVTTASDGAVYVAGYSSSPIGDGFIARYNSDGSHVWTQSVGMRFGDARSVAAGVDGAIYVVGSTYPSADALSDAYIVRYNSDGSKVWSRLLSGTGYDYANGVTTGADGAIYVVGGTDSSTLGSQVRNGGGADGFITRYNTDGSMDWTRLISGAGDYVAKSVTAGADGAIYVAGTYTSPLAEGQQIRSDQGFITRYNSDGTQAWSQLIGGWWSEASRVTTGEDGAIYVVGFQNGDAFINRYDSDGGKAWTRWLGGMGSDKATGVTVGSDGAIYVAGVTESPILDGHATSGISDAFLMKLGPSNVIASENTKAVTTIAVTDPLLGASPKFTLTGSDAGLFKISTKGVLTFAAAKDYEQPVDANRDNVYEVSVTMTDAKMGYVRYVVTKDLEVSLVFSSMLGTTASDTLKGTAGYDTLDGLEGDDKLTGGTGLDTFLVSSGHDTILDFNALSKGATGSEILQVSVGAVATATLKAAWTATSDSFNFGDTLIITSGLTVDLSGVTSGAGWAVRATTFWQAARALTH